MAEPNKPKRTRSTRAKAKPAAKADVEEAVVVDAAVETDVEHADDAVAKTVEEAAVEIAESADFVAGDAPLEDAINPDPEPAISPAPAAPEQRGSLMPMVLGGVIAAALGAGALYLAQTNGWVQIGDDNGDLIAQIDAQSAEITELKTELAATSAGIESLRSGIVSDMVPVQQSVENVAGVIAAVEQRIAGLAARIDQTDARVSSVETQPIPKAELPAEVVAAFEAQLDDMLKTVDIRFSEMQTALDGKLAEIAAAQATALATEEQALQAARQAEAKAAMSQIAIAMDTGAEFGDQLDLIAQKSGLEIPPALRSAALGVPTLDILRSGFPEAARLALTASAREAASDGSVSPLNAFFRTQLGVRSLEPREGNDPDAILSRAEAAISADDLETALSEIATLPQAGQDALADWVTEAETRRIALTAAAELATQFETN